MIQSLDERLQTLDPDFARKGFATAIWPEAGGVGSDIHVVLPGSFNPLHPGHSKMADFAQTRYQKDVFYELSLSNADKSDIDEPSLESRIKQLFAPHGLLLTKAPTFAQKSELFPNTVFLVGADTVVRIDDPKFYRDHVSLRDKAIDELEGNGCKFLVFPRWFGNKMNNKTNIALSKRILRLCDFVSPDVFDIRISSTQLRNQRTDETEPRRPNSTERP